MRTASSREPIASAAKTETVIAVPMAMAKVANTPAHANPCPIAKTSTRIAPVQGRTPIAAASVMALRHDQAPCSWLGSGMWA